MKSSVLAFGMLIALSGCLASQISERSEFGENFIFSLASGSTESLARVPSDAAAVLALNPDQFRGEFRRVLIDETWGIVELGYCFSTGALILLNLPTSQDPPPTLDLSAYPAGEGFARRCGEQGAAA